MTKWNVSRDEETHRWVANKGWISESFPTQQSAFLYAYLHATAEKIGLEDHWDWEK